MRGETKKKLLLLTVSLGLSVLALEGVSYYIMTYWLHNPRIFEESPYTSFSLVPGIEDVHYSREFKVTYRINGQGFRGDPVPLPKPRGKKYLMVLGDSFVFGHGVNDEEMVTAQLKKLYRQNGQADVEVINAGFMSGTSPDDAYAFLTSPPGRAFDPDVVIQCIFLGNDFWDMNGHVWEQLDSRGLPAKVRGLQDFPNELHGRGKIPFFKKNMILSHLSSPQLIMRLYFVLFGLPDRNQRIKAKEARTLRENPGLPQNLKDILHGMKNETIQRGVQLMVGIILTNLQVEKRPHQFYDTQLVHLTSFLDQEGVEYVVFGQNIGLRSEDHYPQDGHWRPSGHKKVAKVLHKRLKNW